MHTRAFPVARLVLPIVAAVIVAACDRAKSLAESWDAATPHERYAASLREAELDSTALGAGWLRAADAALASPVRMDLPLRETGYFPADEPAAVGYAFSAERGRRLVARLEVQGSPRPRLFLDLFRVTDEDPPEHLETAAGDSLAWEASNGETYLLRLQPELLRSARYTLTVEDEPSLAFPVSGRDEGTIGSSFGADRDAGRRSHQGIDVFAPRGTPAVAAADGIVYRVGKTARGGRVVWVGDQRRGASLYYAHLDSQTVSRGSRVRAGDTVGLVGNTGNARTTVPHLHFGVYLAGEGAVDPLPWVRTGEEPPRLTADSARLGQDVRSTEALSLRASPSSRDPAGEALPRGTIARAVGASGGWYRVRLPGGATGYLRSRAVAAVDTPLRRQRIGETTPLRDRPAPAAAVVDTLRPDARVAVLGRSGTFLLVRLAQGRTGWIEEPS